MMLPKGVVENAVTTARKLLPGRKTYGATIPAISAYSLLHACRSAGITHISHREVLKAYTDGGYRVGKAQLLRIGLESSIALPHSSVEELGSGRRQKAPSQRGGRRTPQGSGAGSAVRTSARLFELAKEIWPPDRPSWEDSALGPWPPVNLYVTDLLNFRFQKLDRNGKSLMSVGKPGDTFGEFGRPRGIALAPDGVIYVVETSFQVVEMFNQQGQVLMAFGNSHAAPGFLEVPASIAVDKTCMKYFAKYVDRRFEPEYLLFVTSQIGVSRLGVYAFGHLKPGAEIPPVPVPAPEPSKEQPPAKPDVEQPAAKPGTEQPAAKP